MPRTTPFPDTYILNPSDFRVPTPPNPPSTPIIYNGVERGAVLHVMLAAIVPADSLDWVTSARYRIGVGPVDLWQDSDLFPEPKRVTLDALGTHAAEVFCQFQNQVRVFMGTWLHLGGSLHREPKGRFLEGDTNDIDARQVFVRVNA